MKKIVAIMATTILAAGIASAAIVDYSTSFTSGESPAFANGQLNGQNSWVAHPSYAVTDAAGSGITSSVNADGPTHGATSSDVTSELAAGKTITLTLTANFVGSFANQNNGAWLLGITDTTGFKESSAASLGSATFNNNGDDSFTLSAIGFNNGTKFDTNIAWDTAYHTITTTITRNSGTAGLFDVTAELGGQATSFTMSNAGLWDGTSTAYAGFRFRGGLDGNVDSFSVSSAGVVPEPATLGLISIAGISLLGARRMFMM